MRTLVLLRGIPGIGKSTFVKNHKLENYTISLDSLRLLLSAPVLTENGHMAINQKVSGEAWSLAFELLEKRMMNGDFTVMDATHVKPKDINQYQHLVQKYLYNVVVVNFEADLDKAITQDKGRDPLRQVGEDLIKTYFEHAKNPIPKWVHVVNPEDFDTIYPQTPDLTSFYSKVVAFSDFQGCINPINDYFKENPEENSTLYVFAGDLIDRGIQNDLCIEFFIKHSKKNNFIFIKGNHEKHLFKYVNGETARSKEFEDNTKSQLDFAIKKGRFSKKDLKKSLKTLKDVYLFKFHNKKVLVSHGGLSTPVEGFELLKTSSENFIKGSGGYNINIDEIFEKSSGDEWLQVHGHRPGKTLTEGAFPMGNNALSFSLEDKVEFGGNIIVLTINKDSYEIKKYKNNFFNITLLPKDKSKLSYLHELRKSPFIQEKVQSSLENVSSFNFTKTAFRKGIWTDIIIKARGLFVNTVKEKVVARSYDKFFNLDEMPETSSDLINQKLKDEKFRIFKKENGFLGILSYDKENNKLLICTKSLANEGTYHTFFKDILEKEEKYNEIVAFLKKRNFSLVFEVIDSINDPHISTYEDMTQKLILLDAIENSFEFKKLNYENLLKLGQSFSLKVKEEVVLESKVLLRDLKGDLNLKDEIAHEGFIIEFNDGFMFKIKTTNYSFWKRIRSLIERDNKNLELSFNSADEKLILSIIRKNNLTGSIPQIRKKVIQNIK